jgi:hypothetical protein
MALKQRDCPLPVVPWSDAPLMDFMQLRHGTGGSRSPGVSQCRDAMRANKDGDPKAAVWSLAKPSMAGYPYHLARRLNNPPWIFIVENTYTGRILRSF